MPEYKLPPGEKGVYSVESTVFSLEYGNKLTLSRQAVDSCAECICKVSGVDKNNAKIGAYWAAATYRQREKKVNPPLAIIGETGTGKSQIQKKLRGYCCNPSDLINAKIQTYATVRDKIIKWTEGRIEGKEGEIATTIIVEESDRNKYSEDLEEFIYGSYDRTTSKGVINRERTGKNERGFEPEPYDIWAAFIEHRRSSHSDAANARRAIVLETHQIKDTEFPMADDIPSPNDENMYLVAEIVLQPVERPKGIEGGVWNNWELLIQIASALGDHKWITWAIERMKEDSEILQDERSYEPRIVIVSSVLANLSDERDGKFETVKIPPIVKTAKDEFGITVSHKKVSGTLKKLKLPWGKSDGKVVFHPTVESLKRITEQLCIDWGEDREEGG